MFALRRSLRGILATGLAVLPLATCAPAGLTPEEVRAIVKEATIYGFPPVDSYRIQYANFVDAAGPEFKAPWNQLRNLARVYTPEDRSVQTPNSDTPYSMIGMDLRTEPLVMTIPAIPEDRYFSVQLIDAYTHNFDYIGSRTTGNGGGTFLIAGPDWSGEPPAGITKVFRSETQLAMAIFRTQLMGPADLENVKQVQAGYQVQPLSTFLGQAAPAAAPAIDFIAPISAEAERTSLEFFKILNFVLQFCPVDSSETELRARFARLGLEGGKPFDPAALSPEVRGAMEAGMADAWEAMAGLKQEVDAGQVSSGDLFGARAFLKNDYLRRMGAAVLGIYGNSKEEALYPGLYVDAGGQPLDGSQHRYLLQFAPGQLPPVNAFWSATMYEQPASLLVANPINRYLVNSPMLPGLTRDADGGITLYVQRQSPGKAKESNWLPAPNGPFSVILRLYWPKPEALDGTWQKPALVRAE